MPQSINVHVGFEPYLLNKLNFRLEAYPMLGARWRNCWNIQRGQTGGGKASVLPDGKIPYVCCCWSSSKDTVPSGYCSGYTTMHLMSLFVLVCVLCISSKIWWYDFPFSCRWRRSHQHWMWLRWHYKPWADPESVCWDALLLRNSLQYPLSAPDSGGSVLPGIGHIGGIRQSVIALLSGSLLRDTAGIQLAGPSGSGTRYPAGIQLAAPSGSGKWT